MYATLEAEQRAVTEEEEKQIGAIEDEIDQIDKTIDILEKVKARLAETSKEKEEVVEDAESEQRAQDEEKMFADYLRGVATGELRATDTNMTMTDNGAIIPTTIANKIVEKIYDISPILERATKYNVKGNLTIPFYPADSNDVEMAYATEFTDLTADTG